jgi:hypothetical protein
MQTVVARTRRAPHVARPFHFRSVYPILASAAVFLIAVSIGLFLMTRSGPTSPAAGSEHSLGIAAAPVVVEEWSDFE